MDATELFIEQQAVTELLKLTFSKCKNRNSHKGLVGISPSGAVILVSDLYPSCISSKKLTRKSGLLQMLESNDSVMANRGFNVIENLALIGVKLNIPPFLKGKKQLSSSELVEIRQIASL